MDSTQYGRTKDGKQRSNRLNKLSAATLKNKTAALAAAVFNWLAVVAGITAFIVLAAWLFRGGHGTGHAQYTPAEKAAAEQARDTSFDPHALPEVYVEVDYSTGTNGTWYPRGEAPLLQELSAAGKLPPVDKRTGAEPAVLRGIEGIGRYGGTWLRVATSPGDTGVISWRLSSSGLVRWSPLGYPVTPHVAKEIHVGNSNKTFTVKLRRGMKWSDGHPFTADDIMYWWLHEVQNTSVSSGTIPDYMTSGGIPGSIKKKDAHTLIFEFDQPYGLFFERMAGASMHMTGSPAHYLKQYHPELGDKELIEKTMRAYKIASPRSLYGYMKDIFNPEHPRLWPWIYRTYRATPPQVFVRNPYYWAVDEAGNQLPYIDRIQFSIQDGRLLTLSAANGQISMQTRHLRFEDYTELMSRQSEAGTRILHWYPATRSVYVINPNLNRRIDPRKPNTKWKAELLADRRFRQALSLAINRKDIIQAEYNNLVQPSQVAPGPESPFHHPGIAQAYIEYNPQQAKEKLDAIWRDLGANPASRDKEGYRTFPDGKRMVFYLDFCAFTGAGPAQFLVDDWAAVGIRVIPRERARTLFYTEKAANDFDLNVWSGESDFLPLVSPRYFVATHSESFYAGGWGRWFSLGGFYNNPQAARTKLAIPVPQAHPMYKAMEWYEKALRTVNVAEQIAIFSNVLDIAAENLWSISIATAPPQLVVVKNEFRNVPDNALFGAVFHTPANTGIETYFFENAQDSAGAIQETQAALLNPVPRPGATAATENVSSVKNKLSRLLRILIYGIPLLALLLAAFKHPYIARRLLLMIPTLLAISIIVFTIIQLPPGDFLTARIMQLAEAGDDAEAEREQLEELRQIFHFDDPVTVRYMRWMGVMWFKTFEREDLGLLQGYMGRSMESNRDVNSIVGDRLLLTFLISLGTILFTWAVALPIGIYSAVRQYSITDYLLTFVGFIGMCVPPFLLALILMAFTNVSGLFSAEYATQPDWTIGKFLDLLKHIWIPVVVLGVGGTAGMIRVMRANLLDELNKPYVTTARAKGLRPMKLLLKYPVRLALNPFISGIGGLFPQLVSGGAIVAMVLALPTVGPLLLDALFTQDMYLAGSMLMMLSLLGVFGTLVSDLLLLWLDPRIRFKGSGQ